MNPKYWEYAQEGHLYIPGHGSNCICAMCQWLKRVNVVYIWSNEHKAWWKPHELGYTKNIDEAGEYDRKYAQKLINRCVPGEEEMISKRAALWMHAVHNELHEEGDVDEERAN